MLVFEGGEDEALWRKDAVQGDDFAFEFHDVGEDVFAGGFGKNGAFDLLGFFGEDVENLGEVGKKSVEDLIKDVSRSIGEKFGFGFLGGDLGEEVGNLG